MIDKNRRHKIQKVIITAFTCYFRTPKLTNFSKCVICQKDTLETLSKARETSIKKLIEALEQRADDVPNRLATSIFQKEHVVLSSVYGTEHVMQPTPVLRI